MTVILLCITLSSSYYSCGSLMQSKITLMLIMLCSLESMIVDITCLIIAILVSTCTSILPQIGSVSKPPGSERQGERHRLEQTGDRRRLFPLLWTNWQLWIFRLHPRCQTRKKHDIKPTQPRPIRRRNLGENIHPEQSRRAFSPGLISLSFYPFASFNLHSVFANIRKKL